MGDAEAAMDRICEIAGVVPPGKRRWFSGEKPPAFPVSGDCWRQTSTKKCFLLNKEFKWVEVEAGGENPFEGPVMRPILTCYATDYGP